jgi:hypothetical protein
MRVRAAKRPLIKIMLLCRWAPRPHSKIQKAPRESTGSRALPAEYRAAAMPLMRSENSKLRVTRATARPHTLQPLASSRIPQCAAASNSAPHAESWAFAEF